MEIVLEVPDKDAARVLELVKGIKRVKIKSPKLEHMPAKKQFLAELAKAVENVKRHQRGEIELQSWDELYAELQAEDATAIPSPSVVATGLTEVPAEQKAA